MAAMRTRCVGSIEETSPLTIRLILGDGFAWATGEEIGVVAGAAVEEVAALSVSSDRGAEGAGRDPVSGRSVATLPAVSALTAGGVSNSRKCAGEAGRAGVVSLAAGG